MVASKDANTERSVVAEGTESEVAMDMSDTSEAIEGRISDVTGSDGSVEYEGMEPISSVCCGKSMLESRTPLTKLGALKSTEVGVRVISDSATSTVGIGDVSAPSIRVVAKAVLRSRCLDIDVIWTKLSVTCVGSIPALVTGISSAEAVILRLPYGESADAIFSETAGSMEDMIDETESPVLSTTELAATPASETNVGTEPSIKLLAAAAGKSVARGRSVLTPSVMLLISSAGCVKSLVRA